MYFRISFHAHSLYIYWMRSFHTVIFVITMYCCSICDYRQNNHLVSQTGM